MNYSDAAEILLHRLSLDHDPDWLEEKREMAEALARHQGKETVGKPHIVAAVCAAGPEFIGEVES